jgi:hypothetical protein
MRRRAFVAVLAGLTAMSVLTISAADGGSSSLRNSGMPSNAEFLAVARASARHLFSAFPSRIGRKQSCVLGPGWGVSGRVHGGCATAIALVHTPAGPEAHVSFMAVWPSGQQTWTVIERWGKAAPTGKLQVLDTSWHGNSFRPLGG